MLRRLLALMIFILCAPQPALANPSGFILNFNFQPPMATRGDVPVALLEICRGEMCGAIESAVQLYCLAARSTSSSVAFFYQCTLRGDMTSMGPSAGMSYFSQAVSLRLRIGTLVSDPFFFMGTVASDPPRVYDFAVTRIGSKLFVQAPMEP